MAGSKTLNELAERVRKPPPQDPPEADEDSWDEPDGSGRSTKQTALGVQLLHGTKLIAWVPYGGMLWADSPDAERSARFEVLRGDTLYEVLLEGEAPEFRAVIDKMMDGKRLTVRINGQAVTAITVRAVPKRGS
ncbi:MAG: hypothetical protein K8U57_36045 [Planctomycetes bacterium]|nr:hypothetical protein [Planctomycetota bacterium]